MLRSAVNYREMLRTFVAAVNRRRVAAAAGQEIAAPVLLQVARLRVCRSCEWFREAAPQRCGSCGCFLSVKTKWATESCPVGRW